MTGLGGRLVAWEPSEGRLCAVARLKHPIVDGCVAEHMSAELYVSSDRSGAVNLFALPTLHWAVSVVRVRVRVGVRG